MRFGGEINLDLGDIVSNLRVFRELNITTLHYTPFGARERA